MTEQVTVTPEDEFNQSLVAQVRPPGWVNPDPPPRYNLVVIGAGAAGLVTASGAAGLGAKVALVERHLLGGDCLNVGCVPSKALLRASRAVAEVRRAAEFGVEVSSEVRVDFTAVMRRMRQLRAAISPVDSAQRYRQLGVDVYFGQAAFTSHDTIQVDGRTLRFKKAVIATGARAATPSIPGIQEAGYLTNESVFSLTELPQRLAVIGAGPIGCELAQAFARFGSQVHLIEAQHGVLPNEDPDAAEIVRQSLLRDGVQLLCCGKDLQISREGQDKQLSVNSHGVKWAITVDEILVAVGRTPSTDGLALESAGVRYERSGVTVNDRLQTTNPRIFAAGDICSRYKFTHAADALARIAIQNSLFFGRAKATALTIPWCTYTDPEVAQVGLSESEARERGIATTAFEHPLREVDRAILDGDQYGFVRVLVPKGKHEILGATIVAPHAGDMISEITLAMVSRRGLNTLARTIHPYPTQAEAIRKVADAYNRTRLTAARKAVLERWFRWTR